MYQCLASTVSLLQLWSLVDVTFATVSCSSRAGYSPTTLVADMAPALHRCPAHRWCCVPSATVTTGGHAPTHMRRRRLVAGTHRPSSTAAASARMLPRASAPMACSAPTHTRSSSTGELPLRALTGCCTLLVVVVVGDGHSCSVSIVCSAPASVVICVL
jgi:hypothetical protein